MIELMIGTVIGIAIGYGFRAYIGTTKVGTEIDKQVDKI